MEIQKNHLIWFVKPNQVLQTYEPSRKLQLGFDKAFEQVFFTHLIKVINANTAALEIKKKLHSEEVIRYTENILIETQFHHYN